MNLQENIRIILRESTFFRRRIDMRLMEKEFFETLNFATDMFLKRSYVGIDFTFKEFKRRVIDFLMDDYHDVLSNGGSNDFPYDEVYDFLSNHFHDKIKERYDLILNRNINESEDKKSKLLSKIEEDGLYQVMQDTGLSLPQIYTKTGELPREVFERYIKDYIDENGYEFEGRKNISLSTQISNLVWIDYIYTSNDGNKLFLNISEFKNGNLEDSTDEYVTSLDNIDDEEVFNIVDHMTQIDPPQLNESKTLQENEEDPTQKILNFLLRRYEIEEVDLGWGDNPIKLKMIKFDVDQGERYSISTFENKRQQIAKILDMLTTHNVIDDIDSNEGKLDPYTQKVVRAVKQFINQVMSDKSNINESKTSQHLKLMNNLLDPFKEKDCLCDIRIFFDIEDNYHNIYLVFSQEELHEKFFNLVGMRTYISKMMNEVKMELESFLPIRNVFIGYYTKPNCEWSPLNESENKEGKYISALEDLTEDFKNEDCVCDIKIEYKPEEEIYLINVILGNLDMDDKFNGVNWRERDYRGKLKTKIRKEVFDYLPIPFFVEFKSTPRCKDYKNLQESEDKKSRFLSTIEEDGLFQVMQDTGLSLKQIKSKIGELPREVFERYIKDFLGKDEIGWDLSIQISPNKIIDSFYISDGVVTIEVNEVDPIGRVVAGSFERLSVLSDEEIFSLVNEMSQINDDYLDYM